MKPRARTGLDVDPFIYFLNTGLEDKTKIIMQLRMLGLYNILVEACPI